MALEVLLLYWSRQRLSQYIVYEWILQTNDVSFGDFHINSNFDDTYSFVDAPFNTLDHFILSENMFRQRVVSIDTVHNVDSLSDYVYPIVAT